jgi:hypothetical protein
VAQDLACRRGRAVYDGLRRVHPVTDLRDQVDGRVFIIDPRINVSTGMNESFLNPKESDISATICHYLQMKKLFFYRNNNIPPVFNDRFGNKQFRRLPKFTPRGLPDIIVVKDGKYIGLEVKKPQCGNSAKTYQSKEQKEFEQELKAAGGEYYVVRSIDDVQKIL